MHCTDAQKGPGPRPQRKSSLSNIHCCHLFLVHPMVSCFSMLCLLRGGWRQHSIVEVFQATWRDCMCGSRVPSSENFLFLHHFYFLLWHNALGHRVTWKHRSCSDGCCWSLWLLVSIFMVFASAPGSSSPANTRACAHTGTYTRFPM